MKVVACLLAVVLAGCAATQTQRIADLKSKYQTALRECAAQYPTDAPETIVAKTQCANQAGMILLPALGSNADLAQTFMMQRLAIAEKIERGKLTLAEGLAEASQRKSEMITIAQQRNATARVALSQQQLAQRQADFDMLIEVAGAATTVLRAAACAKGNVAAC